MLLMSLIIQISRECQALRFLTSFAGNHERSEIVLRELREPIPACREAILLFPNTSLRSVNGAVKLQTAKVGN